MKTTLRKTYSIESHAGTQQGDPTGTVLLLAPLQPLLHKIMDTYLFLFWRLLTTYA